LYGGTVVASSQCYRAQDNDEIRVAANIVGMIDGEYDSVLTINILICVNLSVRRAVNKRERMLASDGVRTIVGGFVIFYAYQLISP